MNRNSRLSSALHALLHIAVSSVPMSSGDLSRLLGTNPVVVRRMMGQLRDAGIVASGRGRSGGWRLAAPLSAITVRMLHVALGGTAVFAIGHRNADPACLVEQSVNASLGNALSAAEALLMERLEQVTLAGLMNDVVQRGNGLMDVAHGAASGRRICAADPGPGPGPERA